MKFFHGTNVRFSRFSFDYAARPTMSGNGHLGIWLAVDRALAENFGGFCLEVEADIAKPYIMPLSELTDMNGHCMRHCRELDDQQAAEFERTFYTKQRERLIADGFDFIYLQEEHGTFDMGLGLIQERLMVL